MGNDFLTFLTGNLVHLGRCQVGILGETIAVATQAIATGIEGKAGTQTLHEVLVDALRGLGDLVLVGPVAIVLGFLEVGQKLLVDDIAIGAWQVGVVRVVGLEACRNIAPGLDEVVVDDSTQRERFAQQLCHVAIVLNVTIGTQSLNGEVGALNALIELCIGIVGGVHLSVGIECVVVPQALLVGETVVVGRRVTPFHIGVDAVVGQEASTVGVGLAKRHMNGHHFCFGQRIGSEDR